jgi:hypothetical protein
MNSFMNPPPENGEAMYMCALAVCAVALGIRSVPRSSDRKAEIIG